MDLWHVLNRGVEKRDVVLDDSDRARFVHDLYAFNDTSVVPHFDQPDRQEGGARTLLVYIHAFCLMTNHYHLILSEAVEHGISKFMQKLNMGYAKYFNERYERVGGLWQGKHKKVLIERHAHGLYIPYYVHLNPLDFVMPEWRSGNIKDAKIAIEHLRKYRWSSHLDYLGIKNFPSVIRRDVIGPMLGTANEYEREIANLITSGTFAEDSALIE